MNKILLFLFISVSLNAQPLKIFPSNDKDLLYRTIFNFQNSSENSYFCRNVEFSDINYLDNGENIYSLNTSLANVVSPANKKKVIHENLEQELKDIVDLYPDLRASYGDVTVRHSCELMSSRLNNIYIYDRRESCGEQSIIKKYILDNGNQKLVPNGEIDLAINGSFKSYHLAEINKTLIVNKNEFSILENEKLERVNFNLNREEFVGAAGVATDSFVIFTYNRKGLSVHKIKKNEEEYKLVSTLQTSIGKIYANLKESVDGQTFVNASEINLKLLAETKDISKSFSIYVKLVKGFDTTRFVFSYRMPNYYHYPSIYDRSKRKYTGFKYQFETVSQSNQNILFKSEIEMSNELRVVNNRSIEKDEYNKLIFNNFYQKIEASNKVLNYKRYKLNLRNNIATLNIDKESKDIEGLCSAQFAFSDKKVSFESDNIDTRYNGNTLLIMAVRSRNYDKALELISKGAGVNKKDILGKRAIDYSIFNIDLKMFTLLVENGASVTISKSKKLVKFFDRLFNHWNQLSKSELLERTNFFSALVHSYLVNEGAELTLNDRELLIERISNIDELKPLLEVVSQ